MYTEKHKRAAGYKIVISEAKTFSIEELTTIPFFFLQSKIPMRKENNHKGEEAGLQLI